MGKVITAMAEVSCEVQSPRGTMEWSSGFWEYLISAMDAKGPNDIEKLDTAIDAVRKLKKAHEEKLETLTLENEEFKIVEAAAKAYLGTAIPKVAREVRPYYRALAPKTDSNPVGVQDVELATKK